jgi:hypothetical protein
MIGPRTFAGLVAALGLFALAPAARAGDTFRLDMPGQAATTTLNLKGGEDDADLFATRYYRGGFRGGFYGGGYRGFGGFGGYRGFYGGVGYRGFYGGGYRGFYGGGYRGFYGGGYRGFYGGFSRPFYGGFGGFGYGYPYYGIGYGYGYGYGFPCSGTTVVETMPLVTTLRINPVLPNGGSVILPQTPAPGGSTIYPGTPSAPPTMPPSSDGTFPYDGGPTAPVPMPKIEPEPMLRPSLEIRPATERLVSLDMPGIERSTPAQGKWAYPAYGEEPRRTNFAADRDPIVKPKASKPSR